MSNDYEFTFRSQDGEETTICFSLIDAIRAMQAWQRYKGGDVHVSGTEIAIWLRTESNLPTMISIMEMVKKLDNT